MKRERQGFTVVFVGDRASAFVWAGKSLLKVYPATLAVTDLARQVAQEFPEARPHRRLPEWVLRLKDNWPGVDQER